MTREFDQSRPINEQLDEKVFDFGQDNTCSWVKLEFVSVLRSPTVDPDDKDSAFREPHIEITAQCYKFQDRGYSQEQLKKRSMDRVESWDQKEKEDLLDKVLETGVSSPNEVVKHLINVGGFAEKTFHKEQEMPIWETLKSFCFQVN